MIEEFLAWTAAWTHHQSLLYDDPKQDDPKPAEIAKDTAPSCAAYLDQYHVHSNRPDPKLTITPRTMYR